MTTRKCYAIEMMLVAIATVFMLGGCGIPIGEPGKKNTADSRGESVQANSHQGGATGVEMPHIHGLGFSADGRQLFVPAHDGLRVFTDGTWQIPDVPVHDYMGYAQTDDGFYSSGHPGPSAELANPLGLVRSTDGGKTLATLGFAGESDFHLLGAGYQNHAIYVLNPMANSRLPVGLHYSLDDGKNWKQSTMQGVTGQPIQIAVHPTQANMVALATEGGLWLSSDHGNTFERIGPAGPVTAATFSPDGARIFFGSTTLSVYDIGGKQVKALQTPSLDARDAIGYVAISPVRPEEVAIATLERNIFRSIDGGQSWGQLARDGKGTGTGAAR